MNECDIFHVGLISPCHVIHSSLSNFLREFSSLIYSCHQWQNTLWHCSSPPVDQDVSKSSTSCLLCCPADLCLCTLYVSCVSASWVHVCALDYMDSVGHGHRLLLQFTVYLCLNLPIVWFVKLPGSSNWGWTACRDDWWGEERSRQIETGWG